MESHEVEIRLKQFFYILHSDFCFNNTIHHIHSSTKLPLRHDVVFFQASRTSCQLSSPWSPSLHSTAHRPHMPNSTTRKEVSQRNMTTRAPFDRTWRHDSIQLP